jgi:glycosyltransferase involved in cell wall biosynthesis
MSRYPELQSDKVRTIYNGYDEDDFKGLGDYPARGDRFEIVHAGLVSADYRDPSPLLHTVAHLIATGGLQPDDVRITFLGGGSYVRSRNFAESVEGLGLGKVVEVTDRVSYQTALQRLQTAAVLLLLQASDDTKALIPAKAFEYLRIGRPILALVFNGATADLMRGMEHCYVVDPANQSTLRSTLMTLYKLWQQSPGGVRVSRPILQYERRNLTAELARLLEGLVEATVSG